MKSAVNSPAVPRPLYHHAIELSNLRRARGGVIVPDPRLSDPDLLPAYRWAEREVGFFPLFLAVGLRADDVRITGYANQWAPPEMGGTGDLGPIGRRRVVFSFGHVDGVFSDYMNWHLVLNSHHCDYRVGPRYTAMILRRSWPPSRWLRAAERGTHAVQLLAPRLDLRRVVRAWTPDDAARREVEAMGYPAVRTRRVAYEGR